MNSDITLSALREITRLSKTDIKIFEALGSLLKNANIIYENDFGQSQELYNFLKLHNVSEEFFSVDLGDNFINKILLDYLIIGVLIEQDNPKIASLDELDNYVREINATKSDFSNWIDGAKFIIYKSFLGLTSWKEYLSSSSYDWHEIHLLDQSMPYCEICIEELFDYLTGVVKAQANDGALPSLGRNVKQRVIQDIVLRQNVAESLDRIVSDESLRTYLPTFVAGIVNNEANIFHDFLGKLTEKHPTEHRFSILYALGVSCPDEPTCMNSFKEVLDKSLKNWSVSTSEYLTLCNLKKHLTDDVVEMLVEVSKTSSETADQRSITSYLSENIEHYQEQWFIEVASNVFKSPNKDIKNNLSYLLHLLSEKDLPLCYDLLTVRFEHIGQKHFIENNLREVINKDLILFSERLTHWLNSDNWLVHSALLKLCSGSNIEESYFKLSKEILTNLASRDKLYIGIKIVGYIYSKDHLQKLMFSLMESVEETERTLLQNLYSLFQKYVIYNYRSTLETIDDMLTNGNLPAHLSTFYTALKNSFERYFQQLKLVKDFKELRPGSKLNEFVQFYQQHQYAEISKAANQGGLASFFKGVSVHSQKWAIRRPDEPVHDVKPMGSIQHSMEYPSGEKLDPTHQESMRRTYQRKKRDEINLS